MLDRLRERNGQTLGELCGAVDDDPPVGHPAPRRARGGEPDQHRAAGTGEAPLPQSRPPARDPGALDRPLRAPRLRVLSTVKARAEEADGRDPVLRLRHLHPEHARAGVARPHRRGTDRRVLGAPQRLRLAAGLDVAARPLRRLGDLRHRRRGARGRPPAPARDHLRRGHPRDVHDRALRGDRAADRRCTRTSRPTPTTTPCPRAGRPCSPTSSRCSRPASRSPRHPGRWTTPRRRRPLRRATRARAGSPGRRTARSRGSPRDRRPGRAA